MSFTIDKGHEIPRYSPVCTFCKHAQDFRCCAAFDEIPLAIWSGENDHTRPFPGDGGVRFEPNEAVT